MRPASPEPVAVAILAKAPIPGVAKTRLIPVLGPDGAAALQDRFIARTVETAIAAAIGPVTLWATPDENHPAFASLAVRFSLSLRRQGETDLGGRMLAAFADGPTIVIGTDCPALTPGHLRSAAAILRDGIDVVLVPVLDGGYALIGARRPEPHLFADMAWSAPDVMARTRRACARRGLSWREPARLWDVDEPRDLERLAQEAVLGPAPAMPAGT